MKLKHFGIIFGLFLAFAVIYVMEAQAQDSTAVSALPPLYHLIFSEAFLAAITAVVTGVQLIKNATNLHGTAALVLAVIASFLVSFLNNAGQPIAYILMVGAAAALVTTGAVRLSTIIGKKFHDAAPKKWMRQESKTG